MKVCHYGWQMGGKGTTISLVNYLSSSFCYDRSYINFFFLYVREPKLSALWKGS